MPIELACTSLICNVQYATNNCACWHRDMLLRYKSLAEMADLELMCTEAEQHPATSGLPDVLRQLLAFLQL